MNSYTLQFQSKEFEYAFTQNQKPNEHFVNLIGALVNLSQCIVLFCGVFFINTSIKIGDIAVTLAFFVLACASYFLYFFWKFPSYISNILFFLKNIIACMIVGITEIAVEDNTEVLASSAKINFQPLLGILLVIEIFCCISGTNFLLKAGSCAVNLVVYCISLKGTQSVGLIIAVSFGMAYYLVHSYVEERMKRKLFMGKQRSTELQFLIDKLLPINVVVTKYNPKEERSFLHQVNRKAQNSFKITDNDSFKDFAMKIMIIQDPSEEFNPASQQQNKLSESEENRQKKDSQKSLFVYMESLAKQTYENQLHKKIQSGKDKAPAYSPLLRRDTHHMLHNRNSISKLQKTKNNSFRISDDRMTKMSRGLSIEKDKGIAQLEEVEKKIGSMDYLKASLSFIGIEKKTSQIGSNLRKQSSLNFREAISNSNNNNNSFKNSNIINISSENAFKISFEQSQLQQQQQQILDSPNKIKSSYLPSKLDRLSVNQMNTPHQGFNSLLLTTYQQPLAQNNSQTCLSPSVAGNDRFVRRGMKKSTVLRKVSNFNLRAGVANAKIKYCEDVYDRIDVLTGIYTDSEGRQRQIQIKIYTYNVSEQYQVILFEDESLAGQVKYLKELNSFLYKSFADSLDQFRMPLAYSLLKLGKAYEAQRNPEECNAGLVSGDSIDNFKFDANYLTNSLSTPNIVSANPNNNILSNNINNNNKSGVGTYSSDLLPVLNISPSTHSPNKLQLNIAKNVSSSSATIFPNILGKEEPSTAVQSMLLDNTSRERMSSNALNTLWNSVDDTRYYGFLTLNGIYNYIDYIALLQKKSLEIRTAEISLRKMLNSIISVIEGQAKKKDVRIIFLNELKFDKLVTDERRVKQVLLHFLSRMLQRTHKGSIAIRVSIHKQHLETIKISLFSSANQAYPLVGKARLRFTTVQDILASNSNKDLIEGTVATKIIGNLGPYSKIEIPPIDQGTSVVFQIFSDMTILQQRRRSSSHEENEGLQAGSLLQQQHVPFKSYTNFPQEGEITQNSSCDLNYIINKVIFQDINQSLVNMKFLPDFASDMRYYQKKELDDVIARTSPTRFTFTPQKQSFYVDVNNKDGQIRSQSASTKPLGLEEEGHVSESPNAQKARHFSEQISVSASLASSPQLSLNRKQAHPQDIFFSKDFFAPKQSPRSYNLIAKTEGEGGWRYEGNKGKREGTLEETFNNIQAHTETSQSKRPSSQTKTQPKTMTGRTRLKESSFKESFDRPEGTSTHFEDRSPFISSAKKTSIARHKQSGSIFASEVDPIRTSIISLTQIQ